MPATAESQFEKLKPGDEVILCGGSGLYVGASLHKVYRVTPKFILLREHGTRYRRSDGWGPRDPWHQTRIKLPTPEAVERINRSLMIEKLCHLQRKDLEHFTTDQLRQLIDLVGRTPKKG